MQLKSLGRDLRRALRKTAVRFINRIHKDPRSRFKDNHYYITLGWSLVSLRPYSSWRVARAAAKRFHKNAFIMRGATLNKHVSEAQFRQAKSNWDQYAMQGR